MIKLSIPRLNRPGAQVLSHWFGEALLRSGLLYVLTDLAVSPECISYRLISASPCLGIPHAPERKLPMQVVQCYRGATCTEERHPFVLTTQMLRGPLHLIQDHPLLELNDVGEFSILAHFERVDSLERCGVKLHEVGRIIMESESPIVLASIIAALIDLDLGDGVDA